MDNTQARQARGMNSMPIMLGVEKPATMSITSKICTHLVSLALSFYQIDSRRSLLRRPPADAFSGCVVGQFRYGSHPGGIHHYPTNLRSGRVQCDGPLPISTTSLTVLHYHATTTDRTILYHTNPSGRATLSFLHARRWWLWRQQRACTARSRTKPRFPTVPR